MRVFAAGLLCVALIAGCASKQREDLSAREVAVQIPSGGELLPGTLYLAEGKGPHPTLVWFHGFPGLPEPAPASIDILRGAGLNVLYFHYRGSWGAAGTFSAAHALEDAAAALQFVRSPRAPASWRADRHGIVAVGDSFGSWVALQAAAADADVACVAGALVLDLGRLGSDIAGNAEIRAGYLGMFSQIAEDPALQFRFEAGAEGLIEEIAGDRARHDLLSRAHALADRPVLLIGAKQDALAPVAAHLQPVAAALRASGNTRVTQTILPGGHELADAEYSTLLAHWVRHNCVD